MYDIYGFSTINLKLQLTRMRKVLLGCFLLLLMSTIDAQTLVVLGTTQDAGKPQIGCQQSCCSNLKNRFYVSSLGVSDTKNKKNYFLYFKCSFTP